MGNICQPEREPNRGGFNRPPGGTTNTGFNRPP